MLPTSQAVTVAPPTLVVSRDQPRKSTSAGPRSQRCRYRRHLPAQRRRFSCAAAASSSSPYSVSTSGGRVVGCLYRKSRVRSHKMTDGDCMVDRDNFNQWTSVVADSRHSDDVIFSSSADSSSSPGQEDSKFMTSSDRYRHDDHTLPVDHETGNGNRRVLQLVLRYGVGRLGVAVGGECTVMVKVVRRYGEGYKAGLKVGDAILEIEGRDVRHSPVETVAGLLRSWTAETLRLTVARLDRDDSGHASSSSSHDDVTSAYPSSHESQQSVSGVIKRRGRRQVRTERISSLIGRISDGIVSLAVPLRDADLLTADQTTALFQNIANLPPIAARYEAALRHNRSSSEKSAELNHVAVSWRLQYIDYNSGLQQALATYGELLRNKPSFAEFVRTREAESCARLKAFLRLPSALDKSLRRAMHVSAISSDGIILGEL